MLLFFGGLLEIGRAIGLKFTDGFTRLWPTTWTVMAIAASVVLLALAVRTQPIGTAYAVRTDMGAAGTVILGLVLFAELATLARLFFVGPILASIVSPKLVTR